MFYFLKKRISRRLNPFMNGVHLHRTDAMSQPPQRDHHPKPLVIFYLYLCHIDIWLDKFKMPERKVNAKKKKKKKLNN